MVGVAKGGPRPGKAADPAPEAGVDKNA